jgi:hypothetical protein
MDRRGFELSDILGPLLLTFGLSCAVAVFALGDPNAQGPATLAFACCLIGIPATLWGWERADRRELRRFGTGGTGGVLGRLGTPERPARRAA